MHPVLVATEDVIIGGALVLQILAHYEMLKDWKFGGCEARSLKKEGGGAWVRKMYWGLIGMSIFEL